MNTSIPGESRPEQAAGIPTPLTYAQAMKRLEEIVGQIDRKELEIDRLTALIKEAKALVAFCNDQLTHIESEVEQLLADDGDSAQPAR